VVIVGSDQRHLRFDTPSTTRAPSMLSGGGTRQTSPTVEDHLWPVEKDLSAVDRRALTEMLVDKIIIERHPSKIDKDGRRHYLIRAIPYQDPQQEAERL
jgi:hypothetical protein